MAKKPPKRSSQKRKKKSPRFARIEWVGGRYLAPAYITEDTPYRPEMMLWLELPEELLLAAKLVDPSGPPVTLGDTLREAMSAPMGGPPRRPARVRVADSRLAAEVREAVPEVTVEVAPTPELDQVFEAMSESLCAEGEFNELSYFEEGQVPPGAVEDLFRSAQALYRAAPWTVAMDDQVLRLDIPQLEVEGACVSIIGALGESLGLIIFPSLLAFEDFVEEAMDQETDDGPSDLRTSFLSLNFERGADLPTTMRREAATHGWPVDAPTAYPMIQHIDMDGMSRPLTEVDVRAVAACADAVAQFFGKHRALFEDEFVDQPICESFIHGDNLEVHLTAPYESGPISSEMDSGLTAPPIQGLPLMGREHDSSAAATPAVKVGRNQLCPCGSGKKYKRCCLQQDQAERTTETAPSRVHDMDRRLFEQMMRYARRRFDKDCFQGAQYDFEDVEQSMQLFGPWLVYHVLFEDKPLAQWFVEERGRGLSSTERSWLSAQAEAWLSVWEVLEVEPGRSITLRDLLTEEQRTVQEVSGSRGLARRDALLARVVDHDGISVLGGNHPRPLTPAAAAEVVRRMRGRLRRKRAVPVERLRDEKHGRYLIARWEEAVEELDSRRGILPRLQTTDGEELLLTADHFAFELADRQEIARRIAALENVEPPDPAGSDSSYVFTKSGNAMHRSWENTVIGRAIFAGSKLRLETISVKRADSMRAQVEAACGDLIRHLARDHGDPLSMIKDLPGVPGGQHELSGLQGMGGSGRSGPRGKGGPRGMGGPGQSAGAGIPDGIPAEVENQLIRDFKAREYADWPDYPLPALQGKTAREAIQTRAGREQVDLLLKEMENNEARTPAGQRFDFNVLRRELGL